MLIEPYIRIAVISDLHCQKAENSSKITRLHTQLLDKPINAHPVESLKNAIKKKNKEVDYFFVLGDITDKSNLEGFILGTKYIKEINSLLKAKKLIFTVGNHDMYRKKKDEKEIQDSEYMMRHTLGFPFLFEKNIDKEEEVHTKEIERLENEFWAKKYCVIEDEKAIILVLNTCCFMDHADTSQPIKFNEELENEIRNQLSQFNYEHKVKIAICHHHPEQHSDFNDAYTSLDSINRGDKLIELLENHKFTLLMHGHKHFPQLKYHGKLPVFCSGSFSSLENTSNFSEDNTVHFIEIYQENSNGKESYKYKGIIETWIYNYTIGWTKSKDLNSRFPVYAGFGSHSNIDSIVDDIYNHFYKENEEKKSSEIYIPIPMDDIINKFPEIRFFTPIQQKEFEEDLSKFDISISHDKDGKSFRKNYKKL